MCRSVKPSRATLVRVAFDCSRPLSCQINLARQEGLEPPTYCLEGSCSIQLSYWRISMERVTGIGPAYPAWKAGVLPLNYTRTCPTRIQLWNSSIFFENCQGLSVKFFPFLILCHIFVLSAQNCLRRTRFFVPKHLTFTCGGSTMYLVWCTLPQFFPLVHVS